MAERRMFNKNLLLSDQFIRLQKSAQLLYIFINLQADDDGICGNARALAKMCGCGPSQLQTLSDGGWLLLFDTGEVAVTHWHIHNRIRKSRYKPSLCTHVTRCLQKDPDGAYRLAPPGCQMDDQWSTQERIGKDSLDKVSSDKDSLDQNRLEEENLVPAEPAGSSSMPPQAASYDSQINFDKILYDYQNVCRDLAPCPELTPALRRMIAERYREGYTQLRLLGVFQTAEMSRFLTGKVDSRGWKASLEWLLDPQHIRDVENGKYADWY